MGKFMIKESKAGITFAFIDKDEVVLRSVLTFQSRQECYHFIEVVLSEITPSHVDDLTADLGKQITDPKFEIFNLDDVGYRFRMRSAKGQIIAESTDYTSKLSCINGIDCVIKSIMPVV